MARIARGRWTHAHEGDLTVFLIGMRINALHRPDAWLPTLAAMGPMLAELARDPDSGFLGYRMTLGWRGPVLVQYWRSVEDVYRYATDTGAGHRPGVDRLQPARPPGPGRGRGLARDLPGRPCRERLRRPAGAGVGRRHGDPPGDRPAGPARGPPRRLKKDPSGASPRAAGGRPLAGPRRRSFDG